MQAINEHIAGKQISWYNYWERYFWRKWRKNVYLNLLAKRKIRQKTDTRQMQQNIESARLWADHKKEISSTSKKRVKNSDGAIKLKIQLWKFPLDQAESKNNERQICTSFETWRLRLKGYFYNTGNKITKKQISKYTKNIA